MAGSIESILAQHQVPFVKLGETRLSPRLMIEDLVEEEEEFLFDVSISQLRSWWESTSSRLELLQSDPSTAESERMTHSRVATPRYQLSFRPKNDVLNSPFDRPRVAILREEGTNGDREMAAAFFTAGLEPWDITMSDLLAGRATLGDFRGLVFPGGFSFMDVFGSGKGWAGAIRFNDKLREMFDRFYDRSDTFSLGVCNGCQLMALLGRVPWHGLAETAQPRFIRNTSRRFESRWATVQVTKSPSIFFRGMEGSTLGIWVAHGEGKLVFPDPSLLDAARRNSLAPLAYVNPDGAPTEEYPYNPNGSPQGLTALCTSDGRHLAMMPHPERCFLKWQWPWMPEDWKRDLSASPWLRMFQNARTWCMER